MRVDKEKVKSIVREWVATTLLGEPEGVTSLREAYVEYHLERCLAVMELLPESERGGRLLEVGSGLYLMTFLVRGLSGYELELVQYWDMPDGDYQSVLVNRETGKREAVRFRQFNVETSPFPYPDGSFDTVLNCEVIEHLLRDPVHMLSECHRVLKPGGSLILSTPNVLDLSKVEGLASGENIYHGYCKNSPYARHQREYTPYEIEALLDWTGFKVERMEVRSVGPRKAGGIGGGGGVKRRLRRLLLKAVSSGRDRRGGHILVSARKVKEGKAGVPDFLYEGAELAPALIEAICGSVEEK